jgi:hypothetical protein
MNTYGDLRTPAELLLAPREPAARSVSSASGLALDLGGTASPGTITSAGQITGSLRSSLANAIKARLTVTSVLSSLSLVLKDFDKLSSQFRSGNLVLPTVSNSNPVPSTAAFFKFSLLTPGQPPPASFAAIIAQRKQQIQRLVSGLSGVLTSQNSKGVNITEDYEPTQYPRKDQLDRPSVPKLAQGGPIGLNDLIIVDKIRFTVHGVPIATGKPSFWSRLINAAQVLATPGFNPVLGQVFKSRDGNGTWSEPTTPYAAQYPYNKVQQTESGHVMEFDDTPGAERIHVFHRAGSFIEMHPDGTVVYKTMKNNYMITMADSFVKVSGNCHVSVDGDATLHVKGNAHIQSEKDVNIQANGDFNVHATNINMRAKKTAKLDGSLIDLRYLKLPGQVTPLPTFTPGGTITAPLIVSPTALLPLVDINALITDFPDQGFGQTGAVSTAGTTGGMVVEPAAVDVPPSNPLSNPALYTQKTPQAVTYRARLFDTPEEVNDVSMYTSHTSLQHALGDISGNTDPKLLGGTLSVPVL